MRNSVHAKQTERNACSHSRPAHRVPSLAACGKGGQESVVGGTRRAVPVVDWQFRERQPTLDHRPAQPWEDSQSHRGIRDLMPSPTSICDRVSDYAKPVESCKSVDKPETFHTVEEHPSGPPLRCRNGRSGCHIGDEDMVARVSHHRRGNVVHNWKRPIGVAGPPAKPQELRVVPSTTKNRPIKMSPDGFDWTSVV